MSTNSFEKTFVINDMESAERLISVMESEVRQKTASERIEAQKRLDRGEMLLRQCQLR